MVEQSSYPRKTILAELPLCEGHVFYVGVFRFLDERALRFGHREYATPAFYHYVNSTVLVRRDTDLEGLPEVDGLTRIALTFVAKDEGSLEQDVSSIMNIFPEFKEFPYLNHQLSQWSPKIEPEKIQRVRQRIRARGINVPA